MFSLVSPSHSEVHTKPKTKRPKTDMPLRSTPRFFGISRASEGARCVPRVASRGEQTRCRRTNERRGVRLRSRGAYCGMNRRRNAGLLFRLFLRGKLLQRQRQSTTRRVSRVSRKGPTNAPRDGSGNRQVLLISGDKTHTRDGPSLLVLSEDDHEREKLNVVHVCRWWDVGAALWFDAWNSKAHATITEDGVSDSSGLSGYLGRN